MIGYHPFSRIVSEEGWANLNDSAGPGVRQTIGGNRFIQVDAVRRLLRVRNGTPQSSHGSNLLLHLRSISVWCLPLLELVRMRRARCSVRPGEGRALTGRRRGFGRMAWRGAVYVACSTLCFGRYPLDRALRLMAELEFSKVDVAIQPSGPHVTPADVLSDPQLVAQRIRIGPGLSPAALRLDFGRTRRGIRRLLPRMLQAGPPIGHCVCLHPGGGDRRRPAGGDRPFTAPGTLGIGARARAHGRNQERHVNGKP